MASDETARKRSAENSGGHLCSPPFAVTPYYGGLAGPDAGDPIRRQFTPDPAEACVQEYESADPLHEEHFSPCSRLIHRYPDRVLLLVTDTCAVYCRHCFRRRFSGQGGGTVGDGELDAVIRYIETHGEVREVLLSGGDPLTLSDARLDWMLGRLRSVSGGLVLRMASRVPVVLPERITPDFVRMAAGYAPLWFVTQFNHPAEITRQSAAAVALLAEAGIPVLNQSVLLRGINDSVAVLEELCSSLVRIRVKPYYLFQGDLAPGTRHLRASLAKGLWIMSELSARLSGLALPNYAVDLPGGGGKIRLTEASVADRREGWFFLKSADGRLYRYPDEE